MVLFLANIPLLTDLRKFPAIKGSRAVIPCSAAQCGGASAIHELIPTSRSDSTPSFTLKAPRYPSFLYTG